MDNNFTLPDLRCIGRKTRSSSGILLKNSNVFNRVAAIVLMEGQGMYLWQKQ
jgi:hypothetical protein